MCISETRRIIVVTRFPVDSFPAEEAYVTSNRGTSCFVQKAIAMQNRARACITGIIYAFYVAFLINRPLSRNYGPTSR